MKKNSNFNNITDTMRSHFTLIELLIVIAIIAILAGMLLPALNRARESAKLTQCLGNTKSYGTAMLMYFDANDSWTPLYNAAFPADNEAGKTVIESWVVFLFDYMGVKPYIRAVPGSSYYVGKIPKAFFCSKSKCTNSTVTSHVGYGINTWLTAGGTYYQPGVATKRVTIPSRRLLVSCHSEARIVNGKCSDAHLGVQPTEMVAMQTVSHNAVPGYIKHGGRIPVLFIAGNVSALSGQQIAPRGSEYNATGYYLPWGMRYDSTRDKHRRILVENPADAGNF